MQKAFFIMDKGDIKAGKAPLKYAGDSLWIQWAMVLTGLYLAALPLRPLFAPEEYLYCLELIERWPGYWQNLFMWRLPSALAVLLSALLIYKAAHYFGYKRAGGCAVFYLLLPPVFWIGTAASFEPFWVLGSNAVIFGAVFMFLAGGKWYRKLYGIPVAAAGAVCIWQLCRMRWYSTHLWWQVLLPAAALGIWKILELLEKRNKDALKRHLNRLSYFISGLLFAVSLLILLPPVLRHFHVNYPAGLSFYAPGEHIFRPIVVLLIPVLWFHLMRTVSKLSSKLSMFAVAVGFFLFMLPQVIPWRMLRDLAPEYMVQKYRKELAGNDIVYYADRESAAVLRVELGVKSRSIGSRPGDISPEKLYNTVLKQIEKSDVCVAVSRRELLKSCPPHMARRSFGSGDYTFYRYSKRSAK